MNSLILISPAQGSGFKPIISGKNSNTSAPEPISKHLCMPDNHSTI